MKSQIARAELPTDINNPNSCRVAIYKVNRKGETTTRIRRFLVGDHSAAVSVADGFNTDGVNVAERAAGRLFRIMSRPFQDGDNAEYEKCRNVIMGTAGL